MSKASHLRPPHPKPRPSAEAQVGVRAAPRRGQGGSPDGVRVGVPPTESGGGCPRRSQGGGAPDGVRVGVPPTESGWGCPRRSQGGGAPDGVRGRVRPPFGPTWDPLAAGLTKAVVYWASGPFPGHTCRSGGTHPPALTGGEAHWRAAFRAVHAGSGCQWRRARAARHPMAQRRSTQPRRNPRFDVLWWTSPNLLASDRPLSTAL
ncbi:hypothetical protein SBRY_70143 [Actinacidiphila bryophytorum]|uniref:Uncharacterized protein n=1 Tax=Actinacidiphila bryophytorum TaxID=1436133 RepID=A0A9W4MKK3_9ACTN|nr:hypothetical protein SBRY_70143 [Actinacidiphila bryophytorum]